MSNETGASNEQIDESCRRWWNEPPGQHQTKTWDETRENAIGEARIRLHGRIAEYLVPPTHRIVAVADLVRLLRMADIYRPTPNTPSAETTDRIRALIGGE